MTTDKTAQRQGSGVLKILFLIASAVQALLMIAMPVLAGMGIDGNSAGAAMHRSVSMWVMSVAILQVILGALWFFAGKGPRSAFTVSLVLAVVIVGQFFVGNAGHLNWLHIPLGIVIVGGVFSLLPVALRGPRTAS